MRIRALILIVFSLGSFSCSKDRYEIERSYKDYADAQSKDAFKAGGWLPEWLPKDASSIRELHNLDSNRVWIKFSCGEATRADLIKRFETLADQEMVQRLAKGPGAAWWPSDASQRQWRKAGNFAVGISSNEDVLIVGK